jgi:hypothetical protein
VGSAGVTTIDCRTRLAEVTVVEPLTPATVAVIVAGPGFSALTTPEALTETRPLALEVQVAVEVRS